MQMTTHSFKFVSVCVLFAHLIADLPVLFNVSSSCFRPISPKRLPLAECIARVCLNVPKTVSRDQYSSAYAHIRSVPSSAATAYPSPCPRCSRTHPGSSHIRIGPPYSCPHAPLRNSGSLCTHSHWYTSSRASHLASAS